MNVRLSRRSMYTAYLWSSGRLLREQPWQMVRFCCDSSIHNRSYVTLSISHPSFPFTVPVAEYSPPYFDVGGLEPTFAELKALVVNRHHRPEIPQAFRDNPVSCGNNLLLQCHVNCALDLLSQACHGVLLTCTYTHN